MVPAFLAVGLVVVGVEGVLAYHLTAIGTLETLRVVAVPVPRQLHHAYISEIFPIKTYHAYIAQEKNFKAF